MFKFLWPSNWHFNPRSYMRSDALFGAESISPSDFNPRSYMRSDYDGDYAEFESAIFQSTLLHEERRSALLRGVWSSGYFNPRSYMRSDAYKSSMTKAELLISIHAPT